MSSNLLKLQSSIYMYDAQCHRLKFSQHAVKARFFSFDFNFPSHWMQSITTLQEVDSFGWKQCRKMRLSSFRRFSENVTAKAGGIFVASKNFKTTRLWHENVYRLAPRCVDFLLIVLEQKIALYMNSCFLCTQIKCFDSPPPPACSIWFGNHMLQSISCLHIFPCNRSFLA